MSDTTSDLAIEIYSALAELLPLISQVESDDFSHHERELFRDTLQGNLFLLHDQLASANSDQLRAKLYEHEETSSRIKAFAAFRKKKNSFNGLRSECNRHTAKAAASAINRLISLFLKLDLNECDAEQREKFRLTSGDKIRTALELLKAIISPHARARRRGDEKYLRQFEERLARVKAATGF